MKRRAKLWSLIGLLFASFTMVIAGIGHLSGLRALGALADSYSITFKTGSGDGSSVSTSTACSTIVSDGSSYLSGNVASASNTYYSGSDGLKLGTSSNAGSIKMNLASAVNATTVVVNAKRYNSSKSATISFNGLTAQDLTSSSANYTFTVNDGISYIQLASSKYCWVASVTINYSSGGSASDSGDTSSASEGSATYTVSSKNTITPSGTTPTGSSCTVAETYSTSKQMTGGNSQTYTLTGYSGKTITGLTLSMHSNGSGGAGNLSFTSGSDTIASIGTARFNTASWHGSYTTSYVPITVSVTPTTIGTGKTAVLVIAATANSLYCESITIDWEDGSESSSEETSSEDSSSEETSIAPAITIVSNVEGGSFEVGVGLTYGFTVTLTNAEPDTYKIATSGAGSVSMATGATPIDGDTAISSGATVTVTGVTKGAVTLTCTSDADNTKSTVINVTVTKTFTPTGDAAGPYKLVKNVSEINSDCYVIIASGTTGSVSALGPQGTNNRTAVSDNSVSDEIITSLETGVQVLRLEKDGDNWTLRENANDGGYLYAASNSSNHLKAQATNNLNGLWAITVETTTGVASITAQGSNSHNVMQFNSSSSLFSCYSSASQDAVYIFKATTVTPVSELNLEDGAGAAITDGSTVNVLTNATFKFKGTVNSSATIKGVTYTAKDSSNSPITLETEGDYKLLPAAKYATRGDYTVTVTSVGKTSGATTLSKSFTIRVEDRTITTFEFRNGVGTKITTASIYLGETLDVTWAIDPDDLDHCSGYTTPTSNNTNAATVALKSGRVWTITAVGYNQGTATISATVSCQGETLTASVVVTVLIREVESITVTSDDTLDLNWNSESAIATTILPANASITTLTYTSSDEDVCTVSSTGVVLAIENGTATITIAATDGSGVTATVTVNVTKIHVADFTLTNTNHKIYVDGTGTPKSWTITVKSWTTDPLGYDTPSDTSLLFESTNPSVAVVNDAGRVTAAGSSLGNVNINVTSVSDPEVSKVFVAKIVSVSSYIGFSVTGFAMQVGDVLDITDPEEAPFELYSYDGPVDDPETSSFLLDWGSYTLTSSDTTVLDIDGSGLYAYKAGQATLTATYNSTLVAYCHVVVSMTTSPIVSISYTGSIADCLFGDASYLENVKDSVGFALTVTHENEEVEDVTDTALYEWKTITDGHLLAGPHFVTAAYGGFSVDLPMRTTSVGAIQTEEEETDIPAEDFEYTFSQKEIESSDETKTSTGSLGHDVDIRFESNGGYYGYDGTKGQQFGSGNNPASSIVITIKTDFAVSNVSVNASTASSATATINGTSLSSSATTYDLGTAKTITISQPSTSKALYVKSISFTVNAHTETETINVFSFAEQANSFASYIGRFNSCDYASFVDRDPDTVQQLALEWNSMAAGSKTLAHEMTIKDYNYNEGEYDYGSDSKIDDVNVWYKLKTIVSLYNIANPESKIYLCETGDSVNRTDASSGGVAPMTPYAAKFVPVNQGESSPLTTTLWIVLASGMTGLAAIGAAYFISKKKRERA